MFLLMNIYVETLGHCGIKKASFIPECPTFPSSPKPLLFYRVVKNLCRPRPLTSDVIAPLPHFSVGVLPVETSTVGVLPVEGMLLSRDFNVCI